MRVLHVLSPAPFGGLERVVQDLSLAQAQGGHRIMVAPIGQSREEIRSFVRPLEASPVEISPLLVPPRSYRTERSRVRSLAREWRADILHTHGYRPDVVDGSVGRRLGKGSVTTVHGFTGGGMKNRFYEWLQCRAYRSFGAVVAVSGALKETLLARGVPSERLHLIRNSLAPPAFLSREDARKKLDVPESTFHVGWIGRLSPEKGPDVFLDGLGALGSPKDLRVSIVGDGPLRTTLETSAGDRGLGEFVRFLGSVNDAPLLFPAFDLIVLSSRTEGTPMVLLEAMAAGVPTLVTAVGGIPDMVSEKDAYLIPSENPRALADTLLRAWRHPHEARIRAASAQARFRTEYGLGPWVQAYDRAYSAALERART